MKFGLFGDVHSNLEALQAVLEDMQVQGVSQMVCLGDIVGYNANPAECLEMVRALGGAVVKGNHDEESSGEGDVSRFNPIAAEGVLFSRQQISDEQKNFLRELPLQLAVENFTVVHASLDVPARWDYVMRASQAANSFTYQRTRLCFFAHTHVPYVFVKDENGISESLYQKIRLQEGQQYMINVGSVGQPRDGDWRAAYAVYNVEEEIIELRRVPYDVAKAQQKILQASLPPRLAERLANAV